MANQSVHLGRPVGWGAVIRRGAFAIVFIAPTLLPSRLTAQEPTPAPLEEVPQDENAAVEHLWESVQQYRLEHPDEGDGACRLLDAPVLRWNNPVSGIKVGLVVMWVDASGRPAAAAQVFKTRTAYGLHEFQSLSEHPLLLRNGTETLWQPERGGVTFASLPGPAPAASPAGRLIQMRKLAEQFETSVRFKESQADDSTTRYELRLLRQPIYRYGQSDPAVRDGAVFAFVQGTNPEVLLTLELGKDTAGSPGWKYALAPMTAYEVTANHDALGTWQAKNRQATSKVPTEPFYIAHFEKPPRD